jgi:RNA polymerase-binding transcription factor DksA
VKKAAPAKKAAPVKATPARKAAAPAKAAPARKAAASAKAAPASAKAAPASAKAAPASAKAAPTKKAAPVRAAPAPAKAAPTKKAAPVKAATPAKTALVKAPPVAAPEPVTPAPVVEIPATPPPPAPKPAPVPPPPPAPKPPPRIEWTKAELKEIRGRLTAELGEMQRAYDNSLEALDDLQQAGNDGAGDDQADAGSKTFDREQEQSIAQNRYDLISQLQRAIERIDTGTYGICEICGNPIPKARLQYQPQATMDVNCKAREERR